MTAERVLPLVVLTAALSFTAAAQNQNAARPASRTRPRPTAAIT